MNRSEFDNLAKDELVALLCSDVREWNYQRSRGPLEAFFFRGQNFSDADLSGANLSYCFLQEASFRNSKLVNADLMNADMRAVTLTGADLTDASLEHANLAGADLQGSRLVRTRLEGVRFGGGLRDNLAYKRTRIDSAYIEDITYTQETSDTNHDEFYQLATVDGLHRAIFADPAVLPDLLDRAFRYLQHPTVAAKTNVEAIQATVANIRALQRFAELGLPSSELIAVVDVLVRELSDRRAFSITDLESLSPRDFERLIAELLSTSGWQCVQLTQATRDRGYDILALSTNQSGTVQSWLIECKRFSRHRHVGVDVLRDLYGARTLLGLDNAMLMLATTSTFTESVVRTSAHRYDLTLRDGTAILEWVNGYRQNPQGRIIVKDRDILVGTG